jgi:hypothetical protein
VASRFVISRILVVHRDGNKAQINAGWTNTVTAMLECWDLIFHLFPGM